METTNNNIKIVRLQSGEDVIADCIEDNENNLVFLDNPMLLVFKRMPTGQTVMLMAPWLPIEVIKENTATVYDTDILTYIEPKDDLIEYYGNAVLEAQETMETKSKLNDIFDEEDEEEDEDNLYDPEELLEILKERKIKMKEIPIETFHEIIREAQKKAEQEILSDTHALKKTLGEEEFIAAMTEKDQLQLKAQFEKIVYDFTGLGPQDQIDFPYITYAYHFQKSTLPIK